MAVPGALLYLSRYCWSACYRWRGVFLLSALLLIAYMLSLHQGLSSPPQHDLSTPGRYAPSATSRHDLSAPALPRDDLSARMERAVSECNSTLAVWRDGGTEALQRSSLQRRSMTAPPPVLVTVSSESTPCLRSADHLPVLSHHMSPSPDVYLPGLRNPCWLQELRSDAVLDQRFNYNLRERMPRRRAHVYRSFVTDPGAVLYLRCLPYFYLIGAPKSGTTDLFQRIQQHPDVQPVIKELQWWTRQRYTTKPSLGRAAFGEYVSLFDAGVPQLTGTRTCDESCRPWHPNSTTVVGDGSPSYLYDSGPRSRARRKGQTTGLVPPFGETVAAEVASIQPDARVVVILRQPTERLFSDYLWLKPESDSGKSTEDFDRLTQAWLHVWRNCTKHHSETSCLEEDAVMGGMFVRLRATISLYALHIDRWLKVFPLDQVLVLRTEDYARDIRGTLEQVFRHLRLGIPTPKMMDRIAGIDKENTRRRRLEHINMLSETRDVLNNFFKDYNLRLARILNSKRFIWNN